MLTFKKYEEAKDLSEQYEKKFGQLIMEKFKERKDYNSGTRVLIADTMIIFTR